MDSHIDPMAIRILDSMIRVFIRLRIDLSVKSCFLQSALNVVEVIDFEAEMVDALLLIITLSFDERDVDVAIGHIDRAAKPAFGLQTKNFLIELDHFLAILRHHRHVPDFRSHKLPPFPSVASRFRARTGSLRFATGSDPCHLPLCHQKQDQCAVGCWARWMSPMGSSSTREYWTYRG